jgi:hypothetical protein
LMPQILTLVRRSVRQRLPHAEVTIVLDAASQHTSDTVLRHASLLNVHLVFVPAGLTWLLQPLDTHVFASLKRVLASMQQRERARRPPGPLPSGLWIDLLAEATFQVLVRGDWSRAFGANGLTGETTGLRSRIGRELGASLPLPLQPPSDEELQELAGGRRRLGGHNVLRAALRLLARPAALPAAPAGPALLAPGEAAPPGARRGRGRGAVIRAWSPPRTRSGRVYHT